MSKAEFARHCGVARSSITRAIQSGSVIANADGRIDPSRRTNRDYAHDVQVKAAERRALEQARESGSGITEAQRRAAYASMPGLNVLEALDGFQPGNLKELKTFSEVMKIALDVEARLSELIARPLVEERLQVMSEQIHLFDKLTDTVTARICERLKREDPQFIEAVRQIIAPEVEKIIRDFKATASKKL